LRIDGSEVRVEGSAFILKNSGCRVQGFGVGGARLEVFDGREEVESFCIHPARVGSGCHVPYRGTYLKRNTHPPRITIGLWA